ncbi:uncharacterized protein si:dkeyp-75h12.7 [Astyanax mexicanus]|uniref:uncharacterized protein si:dkeyp-75h12.7 n=1 Tax=Astyanax mexicanus TaxID=7994 RepID=UPI000BBDA27C|nr:uncharacterized protein si:dkeyp-75h12.7 [Astyanax mexicanus]
MPAVLSLFWMLCLMLRVGPSLSSCTPSVSIVDLHCNLHWNCSDINPSTTFIVQTKSPPWEEWQNVSECVHISSSSCDLSQAFQDIYGYNLVRLLLNHEHGAIDWLGDCKFLSNPDVRFSAPSVSVSLVGPKLLVDVALPCAPSVLCLNMGEPSCCPVNTFLTLDTTVTVYNKHNTAETQNKMFKSDLSRVEFGMLTAGEEYCAKAQITSSPFSEPQCVHVPKKGSLNIAALCGVIIAFLLIGVCLARRCASSETRLPKSLMSLQNVDQDSSSFVAESGQAALEEDEDNHLVLLSIVPLHNNTYALPEPEIQSACLSSQTYEDSYYASSILQHQAFDEQHEGDTGSQLETDGDPSTNLCLGDLYASDPIVRTGPACLLEDCFTLGDLSIPLSSVKVAGDQREEMERELHEVLEKWNLNVVKESQLVADGDHGE